MNSDFINKNPQQCYAGSGTIDLEAVMDRYGLNLSAARVMKVVDRMVTASRERGVKDKRGIPYCYASKEWIAGEIGKSVRTVARAISDLKAAGLIECVRTRSNAMLFITGDVTRGKEAARAKADARTEATAKAEEAAGVEAAARAKAAARAEAEARAEGAIRAEAEAKAEADARAEAAARAEEAAGVEAAARAKAAARAEDEARAEAEARAEGAARAEAEANSEAAGRSEARFAFRNAENGTSESGDGASGHDKNGTSNILPKSNRVIRISIHRSNPHGGMERTDERERSAFMAQRDGRTQEFEAERKRLFEALMLQMFRTGAGYWVDDDWDLGPWESVARQVADAVAAGQEIRVNGVKLSSKQYWEVVQHVRGDSLDEVFRAVASRDCLGMIRNKRGYLLSSVYNCAMWGRFSEAHSDGREMDRLAEGGAGRRTAV